MSNADILAKLATGVSSIPFTITNTMTTTAFIPTGSSAPSNGMFLPGANTLGFTTGSTERVRITSVGNMGIGSTSPGYKLDVIGGIRTWTPGNGMMTMLQGDATNSGYAEFRDLNNNRLGYVGYATNSNGSLALWSESSTNVLSFGTVGAERMRISTLGNVAIGTASTANAKLTVQGVAGANTVGELYLTDGTQWLRFASNLGAGSYNGLVAANDQALLFSDGSPGTGALVIGAWASGAQGIRIDQTGNTSINLASVTTGYRLDVGGSVRVAGGVVATGEVTAYFSDERLKANITAITNAVDKVMAINGVYYHPNQLAADLVGEKITDQKVGLLAQEVEAVMPHVIKTAPFDIGDNGVSKSGENYKTLQYDRMVPLLVEAIKEQKKTIDDLSERVSALEMLVENMRKDG